MKPLTAEWVRKAEEDFAGATQLERQRQPALPNLVCFHCQQCVEKYLKARLQEAETVWESLRKTLEALTEYGVEFRYPGEDASVAEAKRALAMCQTIRQTVRASLGLGGGQTEFRVREKPTAYRARRKRK